LKELEGSLWLLTHPDRRRAAPTRTVLDDLARAFVQQRGLIEGRALAPQRRASAS
jgi:hypothetical protein